MATMGLCPNCMYRLDIRAEGWHRCGRCFAEFCAVPETVFWPSEEPVPLTREHMLCFLNQDEVPGNRVQLGDYDYEKLPIVPVLGPSMFVSTPDTFLELLTVWRYMLGNYVRRLRAFLLLVFVFCIDLTDAMWAVVLRC